MRKKKKRECRAFERSRAWVRKLEGISVDGDGLPSPARFDNLGSHFLGEIVNRIQLEATFFHRVDELGSRMPVKRSPSGLRTPSFSARICPLVVPR